jgi:hypothetical protein
MFDGLSMMNQEELAEIVRLMGVEKPPASREVLHEIVSTWVARAVKKEGKPRAEIERAVLEWTAHVFKLPVEPDTDSNDLERAIRRKIAADAVAYLEPSWLIICALVAAGKADTIDRKLTLLEQAASMAVPSQEALRQRRAEWERLCARWSASDPMEDLQPHVSTVAHRSELGVECLTLGLALSLLDGGISFPTERLFRQLAEDFGLDRGQADALQKRVSNLYWKHHNANQSPDARAAGGYADPVGAAARLTVYQAGALEALATDARVRLFSSLEPEPKKSGWSRLMGSLSGMSPFFSDKMKDGAQATLARVVYHSIVKQHVAVAAENAEKAALAAEEQARAARMAPSPTATGTATAAPATVPASVAAPPPTPFNTPAPEGDFPDITPVAPLAEKVEQPTKKRIIKLDL